MIEHVEKPRYGAPCNGCGHCCREEFCPLAEMLFGKIGGVCPALTETEGNRLGCGLCLSPRLYAGGATASDNDLSKAAIILIGVGLGCDGTLIGERRPFLTRLRLRAAVKRYEPYVDWALSVWFGGADAAA